MAATFEHFDEIMELRAALSDETDRGYALHAVSHLDASLGDAISANLVDDPATLKELLEGTGGIATFSARISLAFAMGLISPNVKRELTLLRKIRNDFGHNPKPIGFDNETIANRCRELYFRWEPLTQPPRRFFENSVFAVASQIHLAKFNGNRP